MEAQAINDVSWAVSSRGDGTFDRWMLFGATAVLYVGWVGGTALGALAGGVVGDPTALGLDALLPTFFAALLIKELRAPRAPVVAGLGAIIALALTPVAPAGVPILIAAVAALIGLRPVRRRKRDDVR